MANWAEKQFHIRQPRQLYMLLDHARESMNDQ